ncbi:MAG: CHAT domain-containing protein [Gemmatimonadetes bacterium]|nr:CHAT domain-containing protein [Gemmatimonadota bacterium]
MAEAWPAAPDLERAWREEDWIGAFSIEAADFRARLDEHGMEDRAALRALTRLVRISTLGGNPGLARTLGEIALPLTEQSLGPEDPDVGWALVWTALAHRTVGERPQAAALLERARSLSGVLVDPDPTWLQLLKQAEANYERGVSLTRALEMYREAVAAARVPGVPRSRLVDVLTWSAWFHVQNGEHDAAREYLDEAERLVREEGLEHWAIRGTQLALRGDLAAMDGRLEEALGFYEQTSIVYDRSREGLFPGLSQRRIGRYPRDAAAGLLLELGREREAWSTLQDWNGMEWEDAFRIAQWHELEPGTAARHDSLGTELLRTRSDFRAVTDQASARLLAAMLGTRAAVWRLEGEYHRRHPLARPTPEDVAARLPPGAALTGDLFSQYGRSRGKGSPAGFCTAWSYVLLGDGTLRWHPLYDSREGDLVSESGLATLRLLRAGGWNIRVPRDPDLDRQLRELGRERWGPWLDLLDERGVDRLYAEGCYPLPPHECLVLPDGRDLIDRFVVSYTPSALLLLAMPVWRQPDVHRALVLASPRRDHPSERADPPGDDVLFPEPLQVEEEIAAVSMWADSLETRRDVWESPPRRGDRSFPLVQLVGHVVVNQDPEQRGLVVRTHEDGIGLVDFERLRYGWDFGNALVVFSGCQTIVDPWANPSGAGLLGARAGAIVGTWREVDDRASVVLMREFYRVLAGDPSASPARALNEARRATRDWQDGRGRRPFAHPAYWAAFGLVAGFDD